MVDCHIVFVITRSVLGHRCQQCCTTSQATCPTTCRRQCPLCTMSRHLLLALSNTCPPGTSTGHNIRSRETSDYCSLVLSDCFNQTFRTRSNYLFPILLASIDATLTAIVGNRLLLLLVQYYRRGWSLCSNIVLGNAAQADHAQRGRLGAQRCTQCTADPDTLGEGPQCTTK